MEPVFQETMSPARPSRRPSAALGAALLMLLALATPGVAGADATPTATAPSGSTTTTPEVTQEPAPVRPKVVRLSDERRLTRWAHPARLSDVYRRASSKSRRVGRLRFFTEDGFPEVYLLLKQYTDKNDREWVQVRIPKRPNGRKGWVPRDALGPYNITRFQLIVNRHTLRATLLRRGRKVWSARVGVGKASTPTPGGHFWIREKFRFKDTPVYGTHALGTSAYAPSLTDWPNGGVVGLHGTDQPGLIPGRPSHGCIRIRNPDIARLWRLIPLGTPLWIR